MEPVIERYPDGTRINHWAVAMLFVCAALSGLAIFHPLFYFFTAFFGGGPWTRILHPFFGVLMVLGFIVLFFQVWRENIWKPRDTAWVRKAPTLLRGDEEGMPEVGKYNAGQKVVFWLFGLSLVLLLVTGFMFWRPWFAELFPIVVRRIAVLVHAIAAVVLILSVIVHVYAAIWVKGSIQAMTRGTVSAHWARRHHLLWYRDIRGQAGDHGRRDTVADER
ncbi:MAG: formate dehydrogenase subunit gamma [Haliea sp.]|nr:MAG: formate dehydrogenase subunit gamma [Haliea sp.]